MKPIRNQDDFDEALKALLSDSPELHQITSQLEKITPKLHPPGFAGLVKIVIAQQVSTTSAEAVHMRLKHAIGDIGPNNFLEAGEEAWIKAGLTRAKQATLKGLATAIIYGELDLVELSKQPAEDAVKTITAYKGIGPWTAEVYLLMCVGHPDIFPAGDLALQEAIKLAQKLETRPDEAKTREIATEWTPYRGIAANIFWTYYAHVKGG
jgi:DNA-3-methyladenine glycosylase II